jgi:hypothetical protein
MEAGYKGIEDDRRSGDFPPLLVAMADCCHFYYKARDNIREEVETKYANFFAQQDIDAYDPSKTYCNETLLEFWKSYYTFISKIVKEITNNINNMSSVRIPVNIQQTNNNNINFSPIKQNLLGELNSVALPVLENILSPSSLSPPPQPIPTEERGEEQDEDDDEKEEVATTTTAVVTTIEVNNTIASNNIRKKNFHDIIKEYNEIDMQLNKDYQYNPVSVDILSLYLLIK